MQKHRNLRNLLIGSVAVGSVLTGNIAVETLFKANSVLAQTAPINVNLPKVNNLTIGFLNVNYSATTTSEIGERSNGDKLSLIKKTEASTSQLSFSSATTLPGDIAVLNSIQDVVINGKTVPFADLAIISSPNGTGIDPIDAINLKL